MWDFPDPAVFCLTTQNWWQLPRKKRIQEISVNLKLSLWFSNSTLKIPIIIQYTELLQLVQLRCSDFRLTQTYATNSVFNMCILLVWESITFSPLSKIESDVQHKMLGKHCTSYSSYSRTSECKTCSRGLSTLFIFATWGISARIFLL